MHSLAHNINSTFRRNSVYYGVASFALHALAFTVVMLAVPKPVPLSLNAETTWTIDVNTGAGKAAVAPKKAVTTPKSPTKLKPKLALSQYVGSQDAEADAANEATGAGAVGDAVDSTMGSGAVSGATVAAHRVQRLPRVLREVKAAYPPQAKLEGREARVVFKIVIGSDGKVQQAQVVESAGYGFDEAAQAAIKQFLFAPAVLDDKPVAVEIRYTYEFTLR